MKRLASGILTFDLDELIYQQGDSGNVMYVIRSGQVKVVREDSHGEILLAVLGTGEFFGEMSLLSGGRRSATVRAESEVELEVITRSVFLGHVKDPLAHQVMQGLSDRLRRVDSLLEYLHIEQYRVRQDAHDRVYNRLAALSRLVEVADYQQKQLVDVDDPGEDSINLPSIAADIRDTVTELQQILSDRPTADQSPSVDHDGFLSRIEGVCASQANLWQIEVVLVCETALPSLPQPMCWDLECVVEEALTNAAKHGDADEVKVIIGMSDGLPGTRSVVLKIVDDGNGLHRVPDFSELPEHSKGLRSMHSRVQSYGGQLDLQSCNDHTTVSALIPVVAN